MIEGNFITDRKNTFPANDWFDINLFGGFLNSDLKIIEQINQQTYTIVDYKTKILIKIRRPSVY